MNKTTDITPLSKLELKEIKFRLGYYFNKCPMCKYEKMTTVEPYNENSVFHREYTKKQCDACGCLIYYDKENYDKYEKKYTEEQFKRREGVPMELWDTKYHLDCLLK